jgi:penicillin-binding protein 1C
MKTATLKTALAASGGFRLLLFFSILVILLVGLGYKLKENLITAYLKQYSTEIQDRNGNVISRYPNQKGFYLQPHTDIPTRFKELLLRKEDRFFYYHPGFNPLSIARAAGKYLLGGNFTEALRNSALEFID